MTGDVIAAVLVGVGAHIITTAYFYGRLTQKVADLERRVTSIEDAHTAIRRAASRVTY